MKNFFKKLAFVMALAMVITSLAPAAGVFAASAPKLNAKSATLLLGNKKRNNFDFNLNNKVKGSTYKWTTSNKKVATVAQNGLVKAVGNGTATIKLAIKLPTGKTTTLSAAVTVKTNATSVEITNLPEGAIKVGVKHNFNRSYTTAVKGGKTTDVTKFVITSENAAKATINANGFFTATEPGEYTIKAIMAQSNSKMAAGVYTAESKEVKVVVEPSITGVKQVNTTKFNVTFDTDMSKVVTKENLKVSSLIGDTKVNQLVKEVKFDATGKVATVEMFVTLVGGTQYVVNYTELEGSFVAAKSEVSEVTEIKILTNQVVYSDGPQAVEYALLNKDGVDIKTPDLENRVTMGIDNNVGYMGNDHKISLFAKGDVATVTATFHTYTYNPTTYEEIVVKTTSTIVGVDAAAVGSEVQATVLKSTETPNWDKAANTVIATGDQGYKVFARIKKTDNKNYVNSTDVDSKITFKSSNEEVLVVDGHMVFPQKEGTAVIVVLYDGVAKGTLAVTVRGQREVVQLSLDKYSLVATNAYPENPSVKVTIKDQLGDKINAAINISDVKTNKVEGLLSETATNVLTFASNGAPEGTYRYLIKVGTRTVSLDVTVQTPAAGGTTHHRLSADATKVDLRTAKDDVLKTVNVSVKGYAKNNVATEELGFGAGAATYTLKFNGTELKDGDKALNGIKLNSLLDGTIEVVTAVSGVNAVSGVSGNTLVKLAKGNYTVTATVDSKIVGTVSFQVEDTTPVVTTVQTSVTDTDRNVLNIAADNFKYYMDGKELKNFTITKVKYAKAGIVYETDNKLSLDEAGNVSIISVEFTMNVQNGSATYTDTFVANLNKVVAVK
jgi:hypothetical protein